jgi:LmbE family N-acetylglucosaminyl deacetylase
MTSNLVVAPHPDDEVLGTSSLLANSSVTVVHVTDGAPPWLDIAEQARMRSVREEECRRAWAVLSAEVECVELGYRDMRAWESVTEISESLRDLVERLSPERVLIPDYQRGHPDHDATYLAGALAAGLHEGSDVKWVVYGLYGLDPGGALRFGMLSPDRHPWVETRDDLPAIDAKRRALQLFSSQIRPGSVVQKWLDDPAGEQFAPLPLDWDRAPEARCFYDEVLHFDRYGAGSAVVEATFRKALTLSAT